MTIQLNIIFKGNKLKNKIMGWLIVSLVFTIVGFFVAHKCDGYRQEFVEFFSGFTGAISAIVAVILSVVIVSSRPDSKVFVEKYDNFVALVNTVEEPSEAVIEEILDINEDIIRHRIKSNNFMTKGLYSKDVAELNLLEVPEWYSKSDQ